MHTTASVVELTDGNENSVTSKIHFVLLGQVRSGQVRVFNVHIQSKLL